VGSGDLYKPDYVVDSMNYGDGDTDTKFLVRPESQHMAFITWVPTRIRRPGTNRNCVSTRTSILDLNNQPFLRCDWGTRKGNDKEGFPATMKFECYVFRTQKGLAKAPSSSNSDHRTRNLKRNVDRIQVQGKLFSMVIR
jgi:hypothetical protein